MAVHGQSGLRWSLYPLLATMGLCEFFLGINHIIFCLPLYPFLIPITAAIFALITALHALFLRYPNRTDFVLQCISIVFGIFLLIISTAESFCGVESSLNDYEGKNYCKKISMSQALCYGLNYRVQGYQKSCSDLLRRFHHSLISKLGLTSHLTSIDLVISFSLSGLALAHTATCSTLAYYSAKENGYQIRSYHGQLVVSLTMIPAALLHRMYCCTYFNLWPALLVTFYSIFQSVITWKHRYQGKFIRLVNIIGSGAAMALIAVVSFGFFCTFTRSSMDYFPFQRHCYWPSNEYHYCQRVIDFRNPYPQWEREYVIAEVSAIQILINLWLCLSALILFTFSIKSAFTTNYTPGTILP
ncbi:unnamed protein product [Thelazia callipaeda]|uniref:Uncharacterized protein n=1 Tax=Thelazia callipaeda TaxID=103827 RepID=A0A158RB54_THECL|nr:unnamed protein product [Thelazia callipaeda]